MPRYAPKLDPSEGWASNEMGTLLGIDVGTSGCKVVEIDLKGTLLQQASAEYPMLTPRPGWTEQDPESWWTGVQSCLSRMNLERVMGVGVTGQMHGAVFLDKDLAVVRPALLWNDQRTADQVQTIRETLGMERCFELTANPPLTGFQLPKLLWLRDHEPHAYARVRHVLLPKDYIRLKLTGQLMTEVSDASGTGLFDVKRRAWSAEVADALTIDLGMFPEVVESDERAGVTKEVPGLRDGIPVAGGGGDQAAAAVGTGAVTPGIVSLSLGTSGVVFSALSKFEMDPTGVLHTFCHANRGWHAMGVMLSCGAAVKWYRDTLGGGRSYDEISESARKAPIGSGGVSFLPYLAGERCPHNAPDLRASFHGLALAHTRSHLDRALFEGVTFGLLDCLNALRAVGGEARTVRITSGGSKSPFWVQMIADAFGCPCQTLVIDEGPAMGAAILAGVSTGKMKSVADAATALVQVKTVTEPSGADYSDAYQAFRRAFQTPPQA